MRALIEGYIEFREVRVSTFGWGLSILVGLADVSRAVRKLPLKERQVVLLHGLLRLPEVHIPCGVDRATMYRWYADGIELVTNQLNGG